MNFQEAWYVIYTKPRHEKKVAAELEYLNITHYLPMKKMIREWHDRKKWVEVPVFPSYLFVRIKDQKEFYNCLTVYGVLKYVRFGKQIAILNDKVVDDIRRLITHGEDIEDSDGCFKSGQQLVIKDGPLAGISCEVIQLHNKRKILVRIHMLRRNLLMSISAEKLVHLQPVGNMA